MIRVILFIKDVFMKHLMNAFRFINLKVDLKVVIKN
jgi:hypothetical protein